MAKIIIPMPKNCLECDILKEWYGIDRNSTFVKCHAGKCKIPMLPGNLIKSTFRPEYCPIIEEEMENDSDSLHEE